MVLRQTEEIMHLSFPFFSPEEKHRGAGAGSVLGRKRQQPLSWALVQDSCVGVFMLFTCSEVSLYVGRPTPCLSAVFSLRDPCRSHGFFPLDKAI